MKFNKLNRLYAAKNPKHFWKSLNDCKKVG